MIGVDEHTKFVFGKPEKTAWLRIAIDGRKGSVLLLPTDCTREEKGD